VKRDEHLGLDIVVEEISSKMQPSPRFEQIIHEKELPHCEEPSLAMSALGPRIREIYVEPVHGGGGQIAKDFFGVCVDNDDVAVPSAFGLFPRLGAPPLLDVDADQSHVRLLRSVLAEEVTVPAADFHFQSASGRHLKQRRGFPAGPDLQKVRRH